MSDVYLCSFASPSLDESVKRFEKEAKELNIYKNIKIYRKKDLSDEITYRIKNFNYPVKKNEVVWVCLLETSNSL